MIRSREIIKTSLVGAAGNVFLSVFKLIIGFAENSRDKEASRMREPVQKLAGENPAVRSVHGFCLDKVDKVISLEAETDFDSGDSIAVKEDLIRRIHKAYPGYDVNVKINHYIDE